MRSSRTPRSGNILETRHDDRSRHDPEHRPLAAEEHGAGADQAADLRRSPSALQYRLPRWREQALSRQPFLLITTCGFGLADLNKNNELAGLRNDVPAPLLARCDNALPAQRQGDLAAVTNYRLRGCWHRIAGALIETWGTPVVSARLRSKAALRPFLPVPAKAADPSITVVIFV
jgi:hypothetical protein